VKTTVSEQGQNVVRLDVEVSDEEVRQAREATLQKLSREVKIPGFRKGKVPRNLLLQRFGDETLAHQMLDDYLGRWYAEALRESGVEPVDRPEIDFDEQPEEGKAFAFRADVTIMPTPELGEFKGLEVPREATVVADEEVDQQVRRLQEEFSELRPVEDRPVQAGDFVTVDFSGSLDGEPVSNTGADDYVLEVGGGRLLPDLEQAFVGMQAGEEKVAPVAFPEGYAAEDLAGRTVDFTIRAKEIKERVLPALNDDFAKDVSEFETLLELRLDIRKKLQGVKDGAVERRFRNAAIERATANAQLELPPVVVDSQAAEMLEDFARSLVQQGTNLEQYLSFSGNTLEQMLTDLRPQAEVTVKTGLVLDEVARAEELEVADEDLAARLEQMAAMARVEPPELRSRLEESGRIIGIRQQLLREKAADLIVQQAVPVAPPQEPEDAEAEAHVASEPETPPAASEQAPAAEPVGE